MSESNYGAPAGTEAARPPRYFTLDMGEALGNTFRIWMRNLVPFFLMSVLVYSPYVACAYLLTRTDISDLKTKAIVSLLFLLSLVLSQIVLTGAVTFAVIQQLRGQPAGIGRCLIVGLSRILPVVAVAFLYFLAVMAGFFLLVIPAFIFLCMFYVVVPATVVEDVGPFTAMGRSRDLTRGFKWTIFGIIFVMWILTVLIQLPAPFALTYVGDLDLRFGLQMALQLLFVPLNSVIAAVVYHDLRVGKEGANIEDLAAVFD
jgi:hypothetical protein